MVFSIDFVLLKLLFTVKGLTLFTSLLIVVYLHCSVLRRSFFLECFVQCNLVINHLNDFTVGIKLLMVIGNFLQTRYVKPRSVSLLLIISLFIILFALMHELFLSSGYTF